MKNIQPYLAEFLGTFFLCFAGIAAILSTQAPINSGAGLVGIALAHGLALSVGVNAFGGISGAHFNPAVTLGMAATGRLAMPQVIPYIVSQLAGATVAAAACQFIFPLEAVKSANLGIPLPGPDIGTQVVLVTEFILTFVLVIAIFGTAVDNRGQGVKIGGFGIGLTVAFDILACGPITGASMNPARSFGPALVAGHWDHHWMYWVAPIVGGVFAALFYHHVLLKDEPAT